MPRYAVLLEKTATGFSCHAPDLLGCIATGPTRQKTLERMQGALEMHLRAMREDGDPVPEPSEVVMVEVGD